MIATSRSCALSKYGSVAFNAAGLPHDRLVRLLPVDRLSPTCSAVQQLEQGTTDLVFHATGLLAGQSYALRVVLFERSNALAVSMRSFRVGAVSISDGMMESSPVTIQVPSPEIVRWYPLRTYLLGPHP